MQGRMAGRGLASSERASWQLGPVSLAILASERAGELAQGGLIHFI